MTVGHFIFYGIIALVLLIVVVNVMGIGGCGPTNVVKATVSRCYVDMSGDKEDGVSSHYMVATDKGSFEVDNGLLLGTWNADDLYGTIKEGKTYIFTTKGKRYQNMFLQEMPYIVKVEEVK